MFDRNSEEVNFVYYMTDEEGLELIYLPQSFIEDDLVDELPEAKEIYYFRQGMTLEESQGIEKFDEAAGEDAGMDDDAEVQMVLPGTSSSETTGSGTEF